MEGLGLTIIVIFIIAIILSTVKRWKSKEFDIITYNDQISKISFGIGYVLSFLLAVLVAFSASNSKNPQAIYYINGLVAKGGTNWMLVVLTFIFGGGIIGLLTQIFSALPVLFMRSMNKEYRQTMKEQRIAGSLPKVYRKKYIAIFLALFTVGIGYWFYMKMWRIGCLYFLVLIAGSVFNNLGFPINPTVILYSLFILTIASMIITVRKKEVKLKNCIIYFE